MGTLLPHWIALYVYVFAKHIHEGRAVELLHVPNPNTTRITTD